MQSLLNTNTNRFLSWLTHSRVTCFAHRSDVFEKLADKRLGLRLLCVTSKLSRWSLGTFLLLLMVFWLTQVSVASGQDLKSMPWIDQDSGQVSPVGIETRKPAWTRDRSSIPKKIIKQKAAAPPPPAAANPGTGGGLEGLGPVLVYGLATVGVVLLIGLIIYVFMTSRIDVDSDTVSSRSDRSLAESIRHLPFEMDVKKGDFRHQAEMAYQAGDFRTALVFLFSHVLVTLDQAKLVRLKKGKTNRQYLRELSPNLPLVRYYGDVMVPFEQTFFGDYPITKEVFESCWRGLDDFQHSVDAARSKANRSTSTQPSVVQVNVVQANAVGTNAVEGSGIDV